jgi:hypothetical protein
MKIDNEEIYTYRVRAKDRDYTPIRRFYAWIGFITLVIGVPFAVYMILTNLI